MGNPVRWIGPPALTLSSSPPPSSLYTETFSLGSSSKRVASADLLLLSNKSNSKSSTVIERQEKKPAMKTALMTQNGGRGRVWPRTQKTKYCSQRRGQDRWSAQTRGETGGASPLTLTHLYVQRAVLIKRAGVVEPQQHFIITGRQLPFGGEGCHVSCGENRSATRFPRTLTPRSSGKALTCRVDADAPVDLVLSEKLQGKRPSVARSIRVYDIKPDGRRLLIAETGCPLLDHRTVVVLV